MTNEQHLLITILMFRVCKIVYGIVGNINEFKNTESSMHSYLCVSWTPFLSKVFGSFLINVKVVVLNG